MKTTEARTLADELRRVAGMLEGETVAAERDHESDVETEALQRLREVLDTLDN